VIFLSRSMRLWAEKILRSHDARFLSSAAAPPESGSGRSRFAFKRFVLTEERNLLNSLHTAVLELGFSFWIVRYE
jgi:hypothetical protein